VSEALEAARILAGSDSSGALVTIVGGDSIGSRFVVDSEGRVVAGSPPVGLEAGLLAGMIAAERTGTVDLGGVEAFVEVITPPPTLRLFGAGPIAEALCRLATTAGFKVVVGDPREHLVVPGRFPDAGALDVGWPDDLIENRPLDARSFVVSVLHEARFEDALLPAALNSDAKYVGALGSRKTHAARLERLSGLGVGDEDLARISAPVGLDIGAVTPEEIAVAILAEIVETRRR
jgi:xanthine dehydrogenase accessory factor